MRGLQPAPLELQQPPGIDWIAIDKRTLAPVGLFSADSTSLPFIAGTSPDRGALVPPIDTEKIEREAKDIMDTVRGWFK